MIITPIFFPFVSIFVSAITETGTAQEVSTVKIAMKTEPASLHPITTQGTEVNVVLAQISDPLLSVDEKGNFTTEGSILEDFSIEEDGKVYVFSIREGITFHNGEVLDAEVLKFNYESWLDEKLASPYRAYYTVIDNMEIVDDYTLKVTLNKGDVTFLSYCQFNEHIVPKQYIEEVGWDGYAQKPIGTGPYKFVEYNSGRRIVLEKNENYWGKEVDIDRVDDTLAYDKEYIKYLLMEVKHGRREYDELTEIEQSQIKGYIREHGRNQDIE